MSWRLPHDLRAVGVNGDYRDSCGERLTLFNSWLGAGCHDGSGKEPERIGFQDSQLWAFHQLRATRNSTSPPGGSAGNQACPLRWEFLLSAMPTTPAVAPTQLFQYRALVTAVYDGDTCTVDIDLGLGVWVRGEKLRLNRINAPELTGTDAPKGKLSRDHLKSLVEGKDVLLQTIKDRREKYGRYLAEIWLALPNAAPTNVNDAMVAAGHARYQDY